MTDPNPSMPYTVLAYRPQQVLHYTDPAQFEHIKEVLNRDANWDVAAYMDEGGTTIRWWGGSYYLPLGYWLSEGSIARGDQIRENMRPAVDWSSAHIDELEKPVSTDPEAPEGTA